MYSARVKGRKSNMTVAMYQGENAEAEWQNDISSLSWIRHPGFVQLYGTARSSGIHATVLYDDLMPFEQFLEPYRRSHLSTVYAYAITDAEFGEAHEYIGEEHGAFLFPNQCTSWIRGSTGRLCIELKPKGIPQPSIPLSRFSKPDNTNSLLKTDSEAAAIAALSMSEYHALCFRRYISQTRRIPCAAQATVNLGAIIRYSNSVENAMLPQPGGVVMPGWHAVGLVGEVMENSWTRFPAGDLSGITIHSFATLHHWKAWLSQANHIFSRLRIRSEHEDYMLVDSIEWGCKISANQHI
ncbi:hypothetical protein C8R45DRAFT_547157 [Mycena sanguinolenta]|nr:hypothetical protein C8R45DRAFT_547157 [Mycena sanguinolenta]